MTNIVFYSQQEFERDVKILSLKINPNHYTSIYPVPRGGIPVAIALSEKLNLPLTMTPHKATLIVDDLIDSGKTRQGYSEYDFACLHVKKHTPKELYPNYFVNEKDGWIEYWWEKMIQEQPAEDAIIRIIELMGDNPNRKGIKETPKRVIESFSELYSGYNEDPKDIFKSFEDEEEQFSGLVYLKDIEFYSTCEHHLLSFSGVAFVAYIPNGPVIGTSKMARLVDIFARRLQMQERIGEKVTKALMENLPGIKGAACLTEAKHLCIACRGVKKQHSVMGYSSLRGVFMEEDKEGKLTSRAIAARAELMALWSR